MGLSRRGFLAGLFVAPAIIKATSLMPVKIMQPLDPYPFKYNFNAMSNTWTQEITGFGIPERFLHINDPGIDFTEYKPFIEMIVEMQRRSIISIEYAMRMAMLDTTENYNANLIKTCLSGRTVRSPSGDCSREAYEASAKKVSDTARRASWTNEVRLAS